MGKLWNIIVLNLLVLPSYRIIYWSLLWSNFLLSPTRIGKVYLLTTLMLGLVLGPTFASGMSAAITWTVTLNVPVCLSLSSWFFIHHEKNMPQVTSSPRSMKTGEEDNSNLEPGVKSSLSSESPAEIGRSAVNPQTDFTEQWKKKKKVCFYKSQILGVAYYPA